MKKKKTIKNGKRFHEINSCDGERNTKYIPDIRRYASISNNLHPGL